MAVMKKGGPTGGLTQLKQQQEQYPLDNSEIM